MEVVEATEMEVVVGNEGIDKCSALIKWKMESREWRIKVVVEGFGEMGREGGLGRGGDKTALMKVEQRLAWAAVVQRLDAQVAGDGEEKRDGELGK